MRRPADLERHLPPWPPRAAPLEHFIGRYLTEYGVPVEIGRIGSALWAQVRGVPPILLLGEGGGRFYAPENGLILEFVAKAGARAGAFVMRQIGRADLVARRAGA